MAGLGAKLRQYCLPDRVLPLAPTRAIFSSATEQTLEKAAQLVLQLPEKRGPLSRAVRELSGENIGFNGPSITIEAHFDSVAVPPRVADKLILLGFEIDGFHKFKPSHYGDHYTLKFKLPYNDHGSRARLLRFTKDASRSLIQFLCKEAPELECYLELEIYSSFNRVHFDGPLYRRWEVPPVEPATFRSINLPTVSDNATAHDEGGDLVKRADIHVKLSREICDDDRDHIVRLMDTIGFYEVITWGGNTVCTGQFAEISDAKKTFEILLRAFKSAGGVSELTFEPSPYFWRSKIKSSGSLSAVPPILIAAA